MPLWHIYHPPAAFADQASKAALAKDLTALYMSYGMPAFYVNVLFHRMPGTDVFIGGTPQSLAPGQDASKTKTLARPFVRLVGEHIAVNNGPDPEKMKAFCDRFDEVVKPHIGDKGFDWEYHVDETLTGLWRVQGLTPPPFGSEGMKTWIEGNKAVAWEKL